MELTQPLLSFLNTDAIDVAPHQFIALRLQCDGSDLVWTIADGFLTTVVTGGTASNLTVDLSQYTVTTLAQFFAAQQGYAVLFVDSSNYSQLSALICMDGSGDTSMSNGDHIYAYTTYVWSYTDANAAVLEEAQTQIQNALDQMSTTSANDVWLDYLGTFYDVPRNSSEADQPYAIRMIASVLLPSSNNVGMAIALQSNWPNTFAVVTDAGQDAVGLLLRDGRIFFNSEFVHNSNVGVVSDGFFDVTFAFDFSGPITITQYIPLLLAAINKYRAAGTYIQTLVLKNGISASVLTQSFDVGLVLVEIYDQDVINFEAFDWNEDEEPDADDRIMYEGNASVGGDAAPLSYGDDYNWTAEEPDEDDRLSVLDASPVGADAAPNPPADGYDWTAEEPDEDDRLSALDSAAINILDATPTPFPDDWDWTAEEPDEDDRLASLDAFAVGPDGAQQLPAGSDAELADEELVEFYSEHFGNNDGAPTAFGDQWDWDEEPSVTIHVDAYQNH